MIRTTLLGTALAAALALPAVAADPDIPKSMVWSAYDLGSSGHGEATGIANALRKNYGTRIRIVPSGTSIGRMLPMVTGKVKYGYLAAQYTIGQGVVSMRVRAMATAVLLFVVNLIGYGFGPLFIGAISDIFFVSGIAEFGVATEELARNQCHPAAIAGLSDSLQNVCGAVYSQSLQSAMVIMAALYGASSLFFLLTWRRLDKDMVDRN